MFTTCSLCVLFSLYYITPSNYKLCKICDSDKLLFKKEYVIEPNKKKKIKTLKYSDNFIRIFSENIDFLNNDLMFEISHTFNENINLRYKLSK